MEKMILIKKQDLDKYFNKLETKGLHEPLRQLLIDDLKDISKEVEVELTKNCDRKMKQNEIRNSILNGTLEQDIKYNNRQWFLIVCLVLTIFIGNVFTHQSDREKLIHEKGLLKMENDFLSIANKKLIEENKKAVYFSDIIK